MNRELCIDIQRQLQANPIRGDVTTFFTAAQADEIWRLLHAVLAVFDNDGLMDLGEDMEDDDDAAEIGVDRYFSINEAGQKVRISAIATPALRELWEEIQPFRDLVRGQAHA